MGFRWSFTDPAENEEVHVKISDWVNADESEKADGIVNTPEFGNSELIIRRMHFLEALESLEENCLFKENTTLVENCSLEEKNWLLEK